MDKCERIDWTEISDRGLLVRINTEIMHPLGLAVYRDVKTGVSAGALISPDGKWEYGPDTKAEFKLDDCLEVQQLKSRGSWVEIIVGAYGLVTVIRTSPGVQTMVVNDVTNMLDLVRDIRTRFFSDRKGNPQVLRNNKFIVALGRLNLGPLVPQDMRSMP